MNRFGELVYLRRTEKTRTHIRVHLSAWIGEDSKAHMVSVVGGDTEIGALAAAFANNDPFTAIDPEGVERIVTLGESPTCFRGPIGVAGRRRPLRHLVGLSQEMIGNAKQDRLLLISEEPMFIWSSLVLHFGLPALPEWADWFLSELKAPQANPSSRWLRISSRGREDPPTGTAQVNRAGIAAKEIVLSGEQRASSLARARCSRANRVIGRGIAASGPAENSTHY